ncbi:molybdopterin-dependent oxidoreductase [Reichenbachiella agarivorans]|uniref:Molybdopterin-dependent oxidoreductase n=1 Tax=Reichenbachiella agarivorans TaxID=2979464 RepID=A0ABY6CMU8_9BACT|nr:nitrate reductase [Reichenbachiella agarivorans]UXP31836.1 molybdopterin-dependent oxidoreductase [Reichenbachiella agarivorans]
MSSTFSNKNTIKANTTCSYCGVGCGIEVSVDKKGKIELEGIEDHPVSRGMLCSKGRNLNYVVQDQSDRLTYPQMRWSKSHPLQRVDWDTAIDRAAAVFKTFIEKHGPDSVGFYISGQCLTEEYYLVNKLTKGFIGTNNVDTNSRLCMSSAVMGYVKTLGEDSVPIAYEDIEIADTFLIAGANPAWCHPILYRRIEQHKEKNPDTKIIVIDPRVTDSCSHADLHLQLRPGTDITLLQAIGRVLIENGNIDLNFIQNHADGFESYKEEVFQTSIADAAQICAIPETDIRLAAQYIGNAKAFLSMWTMGLNQSTQGVNNNFALINLNLITGQIGKPGAGPFSLTGQPNAMGGREVGGMATLLAAHRNQANPEHRDEVAKFWGVDSMPDKPGLTATQMFDALDSGELKALWIICTNPSVSMPDANLVDRALKKAKFVIVQDISYKSDTVKYADLVLPAAGWLEKEGTMTNSERRISYLPKVVDAPGEALPDNEILMRFARKMGYHGFDFETIQDIYLEHCQLTKGTNIDISGLNYDRLKKEGSVQWPVPSEGHPGTKRLFEDKVFYTPNKKAQILTTGISNQGDMISTDFPLILTTGRIRDQWHTMTRTGKVSKLNKHIAKPYLEIHPADAKKRDIADGSPVIVKNERGEVKVTATLTDKIKQGVVFLPMHWGKILESNFGRANNLTNKAFDPISKQPGFKYSAVEVEKFVKPAQKIVIIGAGAAAYRFLNTYRTLNELDEIHVFSKEEYPFYNRVLLPEYVNQHKRWEDLLKFKYGEFEDLNVHLHKSCSIEKINREAKTVTDQFGKTHPYDILILATGSRAFVPPNIPLDKPGLFTMRDRSSADALIEFTGNKGHVVIVGGGLLGLELASALREIDVRVSIIQLSNRLMERQLDPMASTLLRQLMEDMDVAVYTNDEVQALRTFEKEKRVEADLKSGKTLHCNAVVFAIGTRPNSEMGREIGLECGRGILVNDYLQTSDPSIYAIGEIAEFNRMLNGTTAAAEDMADISARHVAGNLTALYQGTVSMNILKFPDLDLCSIGMPDPPPTMKDYEEILFLDKSQKYYKKCIIHNDKLIGAILMGDKSEFAEFKELIENNVELSDKRKELLRSGDKGEPMIGQLVCSCNNVGTGNLENAITSGCNNLIDICQATGAGLGCGSCKGEIQQMLKAHQNQTKQEVVEA